MTAMASARTAPSPTAAAHRAVARSTESATEPVVRTTRASGQGSAVAARAVAIAAVASDAVRGRVTSRCRAASGGAVQCREDEIAVGVPGQLLGRSAVYDRIPTIGPLGRDRGP